MVWWFLASIVLTLWVRARLQPRMRPGRWVYRPMALYVGTAGVGKSYRLTWGVVRSLAQGRHVRTNFMLRPHRLYVALRLRYGLTPEAARLASTRVSYITSWDDLVDAVDVDVYLDEVQDMLNSKDWNLIPEPVITWFAQHRHRLCTVTLASHRFGAIHNYVRDGLIANVYLTRHATAMVKAWRRFVVGTEYPLLQYVEVKTEVDETLPTAAKRKGLLRGFMGHDSTPLDPVVACCYDHTGGVLPSPLHAMRAQLGKDGGVHLTPRVVKDDEGRCVDTLPFITPSEYVEHLRLVDAGKPGEPVWTLLAARFRAVYRRREYAC